MKAPFTPEALRALSETETVAYAAFLRKMLTERVEENGGHLASNLGIVEISLALVRVMDLPRDRVIYDTGHQSYVHKIVTGRGEAFATLRTRGGLSGFPRREESEYDPFGTGHSGTALSAATGFARADALAGKETFTVAVIGDGAFGCGEVFEALNSIDPSDRIIIILNDNGMSISRSVGRLRSSLNRLRTASYYRFKAAAGDALRALPLVGEGVEEAAKRIKKVIKRQALPTGNLFEELGLHYFGPENGHDLLKIETLLREAKKRKGPSVIHLCTEKGKGYLPAQTEPRSYHGLSPKGAKKEAGKSFSALFGETLTALAAKDENICAVTCAMEDGVGLADFAKTCPDRFFDLGISEEHAMTFTAALSAGGRKGVFAVYSTFFQRCIDQFLHDAALQKIPAVVCLDRAGLAGEDGATHHGLFDLPLVLPVPGVRVYAPATAKELERALTSALAEEEAPSVIRYPKGAPDPALPESEGDLVITDFGKSPACAIVCFGRVASGAMKAAQRRLEKGRSTRVIRFFKLKGYEEAVWEGALCGIRKILFVEEGALQGSFSQGLAASLPLPSRILAVEETFVPHGDTETLLAELGLDAAGIEREMDAFAQT